ncbi:hypothetical protein QV06_07935 [Gallibacterium genomosp. 3]|uniref:Uncharacterized protein n=1 Tax=Gallibacterium genomosp. 3 TaxID=505345 RepID=A0A1A7PSK4_9PAST|nr:hypothetical protein QV06_07935 [Gallibacterium genomosp. 3]
MYYEITGTNEILILALKKENSEREYSVRSRSQQKNLKRARKKEIKGKKKVSVGVNLGLKRAFFIQK